VERGVVQSWCGTVYWHTPMGGTCLGGRCLILGWSMLLAVLRTSCCVNHTIYVERRSHTLAATAVYLAVVCACCPSLLLFGVVWWHAHALLP
jgi:hypothetical protein